MLMRPLTVTISRNQELMEASGSSHYSQRNEVMLREAGQHAEVTQLVKGQIRYQHLRVSVPEPDPQPQVEFFS